MVWNTFSSTLEKPRWRAFIPTTEAMSLTVHRIILAQVLSDLNGHGFWSAEQLAQNAGIKSRRTHGFDLSKLNAASLFYLPAQAADPRCSFFEDHNGSSRKALEPVKWIKRAVRTKKGQVSNGAPGAVESASAAVQQVREPIGGLRDRERLKEAAISTWIAANQQVGQGNRAFFRLALGLRTAGLTPIEINDVLYEEARRARHPAERRGEIARIVRKFQQRRPDLARAA